jgi:hypothetical protein
MSPLVADEFRGYPFRAQCKLRRQSILLSRHPGRASPMAEKRILLVEDERELPDVLALDLRPPATPRRLPRQPPMPISYCSRSDMRC